MTDRFSIYASALSSDVRQALTLARVEGFAGVLFDAYTPTLALPDLSQSGRREVRQLIGAQDRQLVGLRADCGHKGLAVGADVDKALARLDRAMETAVALAAPLLCVDLGALPEPPRVVPPKPTVTPDMAGLILLPNLPAPQAPTPPHETPPVDPAFVSQVDAALFELGRRADRYGCVVALSSEQSSLTAVERALRAASCPWFGVDLDPVALLRDTLTTDETFSRLGTFVRHVRVRDAVRGTDFRTRPTVVGAGDTNWTELRALLDDAAYSGWLTVDPSALVDRKNGARAALEHLRSSNLNY